MAGEWQELLERVRRLNKAVSRLAGFQPDYAGIMLELAGELGGCLAAVVKADGEVLAVAPEEDRFFLEGLPQFTREQLNLVDEPRKEAVGGEWGLPKQYAVLCPIVGGGERVGTLVLNHDRKLTDAEQFLAEYSAAFFGVLMTRSRASQLEDKVRQRTACQVALSSLSFSEQQAIHRILHELDGFEGMIVTSKIAEAAGITRSIVVNGLRKLESAGLIESRSLGMKGTYIRVLNEYLSDALADALGKKSG
ncbi:MAG: MarR family transcriptional regulator [Firmicutes bacterium]|jgi:transcriptional pleiotropic repressor|nr:MarR family transcriptional regulator [Bacillota bacterium]